MLDALLELYIPITEVAVADLAAAGALRVHVASTEVVGGKVETVGALLRMQVVMDGQGVYDCRCLQDRYRGPMVVWKADDRSPCR
jgi:hypothetical protein